VFVSTPLPGGITVICLFRTLHYLLALMLIAFCAPLWAEPVAEQKAEAKKPPAAKFLRVQRDVKEQPVALETAIVRYVPAAGEGGVVVDLIAAVHVGDRAYYDKLNKHMEQYDALLYELVAPQGTRPPKGGKRSDNPIALLQGMMKSVLALESQVERIDYTPKNFIHADLSPDEMAEAIRKRGDDGFTLFLSITADLLRQQNIQEMQKGKGPAKKEPELDLLSMLLDPNAPVKLKRALAEQMESMTAPEAALGATLNTILVADRNQAALKVLQKELVRGKKTIGIFYGAAHMPDFEKRLREDFGLKRDSEQWLTAWDLSLRKR
jgi:hypothetical protein